MFSLERGMRYWLYSEPTDMRKSFHTLSGLVRNKIGGDPMNGDVYIFVNKRRNRIKLLHYDMEAIEIIHKECNKIRRESLILQTKYFIKLQELQKY